MKVLAITQARIGSSRLPGKVLKKVKGESLLSIHIQRILKSKLINELVVATTHEDGVDEIINICRESNVEFHQGSVDDVLERFYEAAAPRYPDLVVRITSDCPLVDPEVIDKMIQAAIDNQKDYTSNTLHPTYPDGIDVEVMKFTALQRAFHEAKIPSEREHVTPYIWKNSTYKGHSLFTAENIENPIDFSGSRLTVDTPEDFEVIEKIIEIEGTDKSWEQYERTLSKNPEIKIINQSYRRNEGYEKSIKEGN
ncbi:MAG: glycosyltransferase family protein [Ginsengibacter sp.]